MVSLAERMENYRKKQALREEEQSQNQVDHGIRTGFYGISAKSRLRMRRPGKDTSLVDGGARLEELNLKRRYPCRVDPEGLFRKVWDAVKMLLLLLTFVYLPIKISFGDDEKDFFYVSEKVGDLIYLADIVLTFFQPVYLNFEYQYEYATIAKTYLKSWFVIDVLGIVPFDELLALLDNPSIGARIFAGAGKALRLLKLIRLLKLVRVLKTLDSSSKSDNYAVKAVYNSMKGSMLYLVFPNMVLMASVVHIFTCAWYLMALLDDTNRSWVVLNKFYYKNSDLDMYTISCYLVIQTFTTCGYGDIVSEKNSELGFRILLMVTGVFLYGMFAGRIIDQKQVDIFEQEKLHLKQATLRRLAEEYGLEDTLFQLVLEKLREPTENEETLEKRASFDCLTAYEHESFLYTLFVNKYVGMRLYSGSIEDRDFVVRLGRMAKRKKFAKDSVIYSKGEPPALFYLIESGSVGHCKQFLEEVPFYKVKSGYFGEIEIINGRARDYTTVALEDTVLHLLDIGDFKLSLLSDKQLSVAIVRQAQERQARIEHAFIMITETIKRKMFWNMSLANFKKRPKGSKLSVSLGGVSIALKSPQSNGIGDKLKA